MILGLEVLGMRILLVEDDIKIASFIMKGLKAAGYAVDHARRREGPSYGLNRTLRHGHHRPYAAKTGWVVPHRKDAEREDPHAGHHPERQRVR